MTDKNKQAPGAPGIPGKWTSSSKSGIGKSLAAYSQVSFTISHGILNEVYYPREDNACIRDMELLVSDGKDFFSEEKRDTRHETQAVEPGIPAFKITNTCPQKKYVIEKEIITDPLRNTLLQKVKFTAVALECVRLCFDARMTGLAIWLLLSLIFFNPDLSFFPVSNRVAIIVYFLLIQLLSSLGNLRC